EVCADDNALIRGLSAFGKLKHCRPIRTLIAEEEPMLEFACPNCRAANRAKNARHGETIECAACGQMLRLRPPSRSERSGAGKSAFVVLGLLGGGLGGLFVAAGLVAVWFFLGRPAAPSAPTVDPIQDWASAAKA